MGINFIPGSEKDSERLKGNTSDNRDFEYTAGEDVRENAVNEKKETATKIEKPAKQKKKKGSLSFFEWRTQKKETEQQHDGGLLSAQERAEQEEEKAPAEKKHKKKKTVATSLKKNKKNTGIKNTKTSHTTSGMHLAPTHEEDESPNLLEEISNATILEEEQEEQKERTNQDIVEPRETETKKNSVEEKKDEKKTVYNVPNKTDQDEAPDLTHVRGEKADSHQVKKIAKKEAKAQGKSLKEVLPEKTKKKRKKKGEPETEEIHLNLLPQEIISEIRTTNNLRDLLYTAIGLIAVVLLINAGINFYEYKVELDTKSLENQLQQAETDITRFSVVQQDALFLEDRLVALQEILDQHIYWTPFLEEIEAITLPTVYYQSMAGSAQTGAFTFDVVAADFNQVEPQIALFERSPYVLSVSSSGVSQVADSSEESTTVNSLETTTTDVKTEAESEEGSIETENTGEGESTEDTAELPASQQSVQFSLTVEFDTSIFQFQ